MTTEQSARRPVGVPPAPGTGHLVPQQAGPGSHLDVLRGAPLFSGLDPADVDAVLGRFSTTRVRGGDTVFRQGDDTEPALYVVLEGKVSLTRDSDHGDHTMLAVLGPGQMCGELSAFDPGPRLSSATALSDVVVARLGRPDLLAWIDGRPAIAERLLQVLARRLRRTNDTISDLIFTDVAGRLAKTLLELGERFGRPVQAGGLQVDHGLTQGELAQLVGSTRETVSKSLADFAHRGWVVLGTRTLRLVDRQALAKRAGLVPRTPSA